MCLKEKHSDARFCRHIDALHISVDGNYHFGHGGKDTDENDKALSENAGHFVHQGDAAKIQANAKKSTHKDVRQQCLTKWPVQLTSMAANDVFNVRCDE